MENSIIDKIDKLIKDNEVYKATSTNTDVTVDAGEMVCGGIKFNNGKN